MRLVPDRVRPVDRQLSGPIRRRRSRAGAGRRRQQCAGGSSC